MQYPPPGIHEQPLSYQNLHQRPIRDYTRPIVQPYLRKQGMPRINANNFELKQAFITMVQNNQFSGLPSEDPHTHLSTFLNYSDTLKYNGVSDEAIKLRLFPFSLRDRARQWYGTLELHQRATWPALVESFLEKFFPETKAMELRAKISSFQMFEDEDLHETWDRYRELLRKCPHHGFEKWQQVQYFYKGLMG